MPNANDISTLTLGSKVKLINKPDGYTSHDYPLTLGNIYKFLGMMGSCVIITTDMVNETASIHSSRVMRA